MPSGSASRARRRSTVLHRLSRRAPELRRPVPRGHDHGFSELEAAAIMAAYDFLSQSTQWWMFERWLYLLKSIPHNWHDLQLSQRQSSENAATPGGNRCSFSRGRACEIPSGNAPSEAKRRRSRPSSAVCAPLHVSVRHGREATSGARPRSIGPAASRERGSLLAAAKTFIHDALGAGYGVSVLHHLWARYELPATHPRARTSDEEVSWRKRCSGISVKRSV